MRLRLVPDAMAIVKRAWSIRLLVLAGVLSGAEVALPFLQDFLPVHPGVFAGLSFLATSGAFVARIAAQQNLGDAS